MCEKCQVYQRVLLAWVNENKVSTIPQEYIHLIFISIYSCYPISLTSHFIYEVISSSLGFSLSLEV